MFCEKKLKSCRDYKDGTRVPGNYTVVDKNGNPYQVFCDFNKNYGANTWTLIQSYSLENKNGFASPFTMDNPRNEDNFTWIDYRLSVERMTYIHEQSVKWRITCNYGTEGSLYNDYVRALIADVPLFTLFTNQGKCVPVQRISIRGKTCINCKAYMVQSYELPLHFRAKQSNQCNFKVPQTQSCPPESEDNFGNYNCINPKHKCSSSSSATTQTWLGGY
ncbi:Hypothetical predicted protein [Paramuricea clavata]|uniref:Uncharacterized protein n=1 Tax=Paramuricea clavata TaxID=317549 RepID=A0A6S7HZF5_PARCT|nr:Hypothetical predicted protein [Paramuricea clavata]